MLLIIGWNHILIFILFFRKFLKQKKNSKLVVLFVKLNAYRAFLIGSIFGTIFILIKHLY